jgi:excisionase family DNA binding protein
MPYHSTPTPARPSVPKTLSVIEVAKGLGVSKSTVHRMIDRDDLHAVKIGRLVKIPEKSYELYCRQIGLI